jgi:Ni/Co efflux regulator RcnB
VLGVGRGSLRSSPLDHLVAEEGGGQERRTKSEEREKKLASLLGWRRGRDGEREALGQWGKGQKKTNRERCAVKKEEWNPGDREHNAAGEIRNDI